MVTTAVKPSVLIVDDEEIIRRTVRKGLALEGYDCHEAGSAVQALEYLDRQPAELVILDIMMPGKNGDELLKEIRGAYPETAVVMATAVMEPDMIIRCMKAGAYDYITKPFDIDQVADSIRMVQEKRRLECDLREHRRSTEGKISEQTKELQRVFAGAVESLVSALEAKDKYTAGHSRRVTRIAVKMAQAMKLADDEQEDVRWAALLHDIGKIGIDHAVQNKPGRLTEDEYRYVLSHCVIGSDIVQPLVNDKITEFIRHHHDRYDGQKTDQAASGEGIPIGSRIIAIADTFDAMTSDRPYRAALPRDEAIAEIKRCSGTQFDPMAVKAFLKVLPSIEG